MGYLWKNPNNYSKYKTHKIVKETFTQEIWHFYYYIGKIMYDNGIRSFEDTSVYSYITSMPIEKNKKSNFDIYDSYGGFSTIQELMVECDTTRGNDEYHFSEIQKYESLRQMQDNNMIDINNIDYVTKLTNMTLKDLKSFCSLKVKDVFSQINSGEVVIYDLTEDIDEVIEELNEGEEVGLPLFESPRLTKKINGQKLGNLMYLVLSSGVGKSSFITEKCVLSVFEHNVRALDPANELEFEKALIFVNEEGKIRWQSRLLATVASRILNKPIARDVVNKGKYSEKNHEILKEAAKWLKKNQPDLIKLIVLKKYRVEDVINNIELHRPRGYSKIYFDTFKPDLSQSIDRWLAFSNSAQTLYDCIKEEAYNCATLATVQMKIGKEFRYIDLDSIGKSPEIVEVAAVVMAGRFIFSDEFKGCGKFELHPYNWEKSNFDGKWHKKEYILDPEKKYLILFLPKNREGSEDEQIMFEVISDLNIWKEVCFVQVPNNGSNYNK